MWMVLIQCDLQSLYVGREMLVSASQGDIHDADRVNGCASVWAGRIHSLCAQAEDELAEPMSSMSEL